MDSDENIYLAYTEDAIQIEMDQAYKAVQTSNLLIAWNHFRNVLLSISSHSPTHRLDEFFTTASLELANLTVILGKGFGEMILFLMNALEAAKRLGDKRSQALIKLHLGRIYYFGKQRQKAIHLFSEGIQEVQEIGDEDIENRALEFIGLYYLAQGLLREASKYLESAIKNFEIEKRRQLFNPLAPIWLGYCTAFLGQFHRAVGTLDYYRRFCMEKGYPSLSSTIRAVLGIVLLMTKKDEEAKFHLLHALQESEKAGNDLGRYLSMGGLAAYEYHHGNTAKAREAAIESIKMGVAIGLVQQYASPMFLEILYSYEKQKYPAIPGINFISESMKFLQDPNVHIRGVALRLRAMKMEDSGEDYVAIQNSLIESEKYLVRSGDPIQLAKTRIQLARLKLKQGEKDESRRLAHEAWKGLAGYEKEFFPDDILNLLPIRHIQAVSSNAEEEFIDRFVGIIQELVPTTDLDKLLYNTVVATNRYFGAERGALFLFDKKTKESIQLRASRNFTDQDIFSDGFRSNLSLIFEVFRENKPKAVSINNTDPWPYRGKAILCFPFSVTDKTRGVLYHDNSFLDGCFDYLNVHNLNKLAEALNTYVEQLFSFSLNLRKEIITVTKTNLSGPVEIVTQNQEMKKILEMADRIAGTESNVLILGETGVGKELIARRIHEKSPRRDKSLIIVEPTSLPESLIEGELFGYEKGAFTGATAQKKGLIELADGGTLLIDEIGEISKAIQVKFLRAFQEKTIVRLGGTKRISCNFRLLAATNRNLAGEVAAGRFREDLYYRITVMPITIPPLRQRADDIPLLAQFFVSRYAAKYNKQTIKLTRGDEKKLMAYSWPGNIRELKNMMEKAVLLYNGEYLDLNTGADEQIPSNHPFSDMPTLEEVQRRYINYVLQKTKGKLGGPDSASEILGLKRSTLFYRMKKLSMK